MHLLILIFVCLNFSFDIYAAILYYAYIFLFVFNSISSCKCVILCNSYVNQMGEPIGSSFVGVVKALNMLKSDL